MQSTLSTCCITVTLKYLKQELFEALNFLIYHDGTDGSSRLGALTPQVCLCIRNVVMKYFLTLTPQLLHTLTMLCWSLVHMYLNH